MDLWWKDAKGTDNIRLMGKANRFINAFEELKSRGDIPAHETYRHFIRNHVTRIVTRVQYLFENEAFLGTDEERLEILHALLEPPLSFDSLYLFVHWLHNDGHKEMAALKHILKRFKRDKKLSLSAWGEVNKHIETLVDLAEQVNNSQHFITEAQILRLDLLKETEPAR